MSGTDDLPVVLVAIDGRPNGWDALEWAAAEAVAAEQSLLVVHVLDGPTVADVLAPFPEVRAAMAQAGAECLLEDAQRRARSIARELRVITRLEAADRPGRAILRVARNASLIVLGRRRDGRALRAWFGRSAASYVARRAHCPVVIAGLESHAGGPSAGRVAVLVDDDITSFDALSCGFRAAGRRGIGVTVLRPSAPRGAGGFDGPILLDAYRRAYGVDDVAETQLVGPLGSALAAQSVGAALLVIGARRPGRMHRSRLPADAKGVAKSARAPVLIVPSFPAA